MVTPPTRQRIAVIGSGIAGITSAYLLARNHDVTIFEAEEYVGGHTNTRKVTLPPDSDVAVDTGFIVCNPKNYPNFYTFLKQLGVGLQDSDMSFGYYCQDSQLCYMGPALRDFLAAPRNFLSPNFLKMVVEQWRFNRNAVRHATQRNLPTMSLGEYLAEQHASEYFVENYIVPLVASIWSTARDDVRDFPADTFLTFFRNHGMFEFHKRPQWQTVVGGSATYVDAFRRQFPGTILTNTPVKEIQRLSDSVEVRVEGREPQRFDSVVCACHADQALALLKDPSPEETSLLGRWRYTSNDAVLHTDTRVMPPNRRLWASWNYYRRNTESPVHITYYMNRLQRLRTTHDYFVTLNRSAEIDPSKILYRTMYTHPHYSGSSVSAQAGIAGLNGINRTFYCGSYLRYGFHEDGVVAALAVAQHFGISL